MKAKRTALFRRGAALLLTLALAVSLAPLALADEETGNETTGETVTEQMASPTISASSLNLKVNDTETLTKAMLLAQQSSGQAAMKALPR